MDSTLRQAVSKGLRAARANIIPGLIIWFLAGMVITLWFTSETFQYYLNQLTTFKNSYNYTFAFISTAIAGGVIPGIVQGIFKLHPQAWRQLKWIALYWGIKGVELNAFYALQAYMFGDDYETSTLVYKTMLDQLIYIPLWGVPGMLVIYTIIECGMTGLRNDLKDSWIKKHLLPILLANWGVWMPTVALIYVLPMPLQLPLQNLILCFWCLIMSFMTAQTTREQSTDLS